MREILYDDGAWQTTTEFGDMIRLLLYAVEACPLLLARQIQPIEFTVNRILWLSCTLVEESHYVLPMYFILLLLRLFSNANLRGY